MTKVNRRGFMRRVAVAAGAAVLAPALAVGNDIVFAAPAADWGPVTAFDSNFGLWSIFDKQGQLVAKGRTIIEESNEPGVLGQVRFIDNPPLEEGHTLEYGIKAKE